MQFKPHCTRKSRNNIEVVPFPNCNGQRFEGIFTGLCVEVVAVDQINEIHEHGCFGKGNKSRSAPGANESLLLGLEEAAFLSFYLEVLEIKNLSGVEINWSAYLEAAHQLNGRFIEHLAAYLYLKSKNWVIKSGIKFGGDFLIYKQSQNNYHASFLVIVKNPADNEHYVQKNLKGLLRVAETSDKDVLILTVMGDDRHLLSTYAKPGDLEKLTITESVIRRFNYTYFVQNNDQKK